MQVLTQVALHFNWRASLKQVSKSRSPPVEISNHAGCTSTSHPRARPTISHEGVHKASPNRYSTVAEPCNASKRGSYSNCSDRAHMTRPASIPCQAHWHRNDKQTTHSLGMLLSREQLLRRRQARARHPCTSRYRWRAAPGQGGAAPKEVQPADLGWGRSVHPNGSIARRTMTWKKNKDTHAAAPQAPQTLGVPHGTKP